MRRGLIPILLVICFLSSGCLEGYRKGEKAAILGAGGSALGAGVGAGIGAAFGAPGWGAIAGAGAGLLGGVLAGLFSDDSNEEDRQAVEKIAYAYGDMTYDQLRQAFATSRASLGVQQAYIGKAAQYVLQQPNVHFRIITPSLDLVPVPQS